MGGVQQTDGRGEGSGARSARLLLWIARISAIAAIVPLMLIAFGERGAGPSEPREWIYLALFPFGFAAGYLLAWRWPLFGGALSLACMALSLVVIGRTFPPAAYLTWGVLSVPGLLYVIAGWALRGRGEGNKKGGTGPPSSIY